MIVETIPKSIDLIIDCDMSSLKNKRKPSISNLNLIGVQENPRHRNRVDSSSSSDKDEHDQDNHRTKATISNITNYQNRLTKSFSSFSMDSSDTNDFSEHSVHTLYEMAKKGEFPNKSFEFNKLEKQYTPRLHFFNSQRKFSQRPVSHINFTCKLCDRNLQATFPEFNNLNNHLKTHSEFRDKWLSYFDEFNPQKSKCTILLDDNTYNLVRFVVSSNTAMTTLENVHLAKLLHEKMKVPCIRTFRYTLLPKIYSDMLSLINIKLDEALTICFITDIWTNKIMADYIALAAVIVNQKYEQELLVIGMNGMSGDHVAEVVKFELESIINSFKFNKLKCHGKLFF
jgi:hypothetical protein